MRFRLGTLAIGGLAAVAFAASIAGSNAKTIKLTAGSSHPDRKSVV